MAFIKALELLPSEARAFVSKLSELRNDLVHDVSNFNFCLSKWVKEMAPQDLSNFTKSLNFDNNGSREFWDSNAKNHFRNLPDSDLKGILIFACLSIFYSAIDHELEKYKQPLIQEMKRLQGLKDSYEGGLKSKPKGDDSVSSD